MWFMCGDHVVVVVGIDSGDGGESVTGVGRDAAGVSGSVTVVSDGSGSAGVRSD